MKYKIQNISTDKTFWVDNAYGYHSQPVGPGEIAVVSDTGKEQLMAAYGSYITVLGPAVDNDAPVYVKQAAPAAWSLTGSGIIDLGKNCSQFKFGASAAGVFVSFSGWDTSLSQTAPPTLNQIEIPQAPTSGEYFTLHLTMNPARYLYVKGNGTATITIIAH